MIHQVQAMNAYSSQSQEQLNLQKGEVITVLQQNPNGWWHCQNSQGQQGWVPMRFLMLRQEQLNSSNTPNPQYGDIPHSGDSPRWVQDAKERPSMAEVVKTLQENAQADNTSEPFPYANQSLPMSIIDLVSEQGLLSWEEAEKRISENLLAKEIQGLGSLSWANNKQFENLKNTNGVTVRGLPSGSSNLSVNINNQSSEMTPKVSSSFLTLKEGSDCEVVASNFILLRDGQFASSADDKSIKVWCLKTRRCLFSLKGHSDEVNTIIQLRDGRLVSSSNDKSIKVWDLKTRRCIFSLKGHSDAVNTIIQLRDGRLVSGSDDHSIKVWDLNARCCLFSLEGHSDSVETLSQLRDGCLVSGSLDGSIKVWDLNVRRCVSSINHSEPVFTIISLNDGWFASGSDDVSISVWDFNVQRSSRRLRCLFTLEGHSGSVNRLTQMSDGRLVSSSVDKSIKIWDLVTRRCLFSLEEHSNWTTSLLQLRDGRLMSGSHDKSIKIWEIATSLLYSLDLSFRDIILDYFSLSSEKETITVALKSIKNVTHETITALQSFKVFIQLLIYNCYARNDLFDSVDFQFNEQRGILSVSCSDRSVIEGLFLCLNTFHQPSIESDFHRAVRASDRERLIACCLSMPERIDTVNLDGDTALHLAVIRDKIELAKILVLHGASVSIRNNDNKSSHGLLIDKNETYFSNEEKKRLLALMMIWKHFNLQNFGFSADIINDIGKENAYLLSINTLFRFGSGPVIARNIASSKLHHKIDEKAHKKSFIEMSKISYLAPLLDITAFAVQGLHHLGLSTQERDKKLKIILGAYKGDVTMATLGVVDNAYGVFYHDNRIYLGGKRDEDTERSKILVRGTLIHEITHFVAHEVFKNNAKPYAKNDKASFQKYKDICDRMYNAVQKNKKSFDRRISSVFLQYDSRKWHAELIVRVPQLIAMGELKEVERTCPDLLKYYEADFLEKCRMHLLELHYGNGVFLQGVQFKKQKKSSVEPLTLGLKLFDINDDVLHSDDDNDVIYSNSRGESSVDGKANEIIQGECSEYAASSTSKQAVSLENASELSLPRCHYELGKAIVQEDFVAQKPHHLSLCKGDEVSVLDHESRWWICELNGREGRVPASHLCALSVKALPSLPSTFFRSTQSSGSSARRVARQEIDCEPTVEFITYFRERKNEGYTISVKQTEDIVEVRCIAPKLEDPLFKLHLKQLEHFLKEHLKIFRRNIPMVVEMEEDILRMRGDPTVIAGVSQLFKKVAESADAEPVADLQK